MIAFRLTRNIESTSTIKPPTLAFSIVANAAANSSGPLAPTETTSRLSDFAASSAPFTTEG